MVTPVNVTYSCASGGTIRGGPAPSVTGALGVFIAGLTANTMNAYTGTNINTAYPGSVDNIDCSPFESAPNLPIQTWSGKGWSDPVHGVLGIIGMSAGHPDTPTGGTLHDMRCAHTKGVYFDRPSNAFLPGVFDPGHGTGDGHCYDNNSGYSTGKFIRKGYNEAQVVEGDTQTKVIGLKYTSTSNEQVTALEFFPTMGAQGSYIIVGYTGVGCKVYIYDIATSVETVLGTYGSGATGNYAVCMYHPVDNVLIFGGGEGGSKLFMMTSSKVVTEITQTMPGSLQVAAGSTYGPACIYPGSAAGLLVYSQNMNGMYRLVVNVSASVGTWTQLVDFTGSSYSSKGNLCCAVALHGEGAAVFWKGGGRVSGASTCEFWVFKV